MPIRIPANPQTSPVQAPGSQGQVRTPGMHWPTRQAAFMAPQNRNLATAQMFSGGLAGLEAVGNALSGSVAGAFQQMAQKAAKMEAATATTNFDIGLLDFNTHFDTQIKPGLDPSQWVPDYHRRAIEFKERFFAEESMSEEVKHGLELRFRRSIAGKQADLDWSRFEHIRNEGIIAKGVALGRAEDYGEEAAVDPIIDAGIEDGSWTKEEGEKKRQASKERARYNRFLAHVLEDLEPWNVNIDDYDFPPYRKAMAERVLQRRINERQAVTYDDMMSRPGYYTEETVQAMAGAGHIDAEMARRWIASHGEPLSNDSPEFTSLWRRADSYDPLTDSENKSELVQLRRDLAAIYNSNPVAVREIADHLDERIREITSTKKAKRTATLKFFETQIEALSGGVSDSQLDTEREDALYNRVSQHIDQLLEANPNITAEELKAKTKVFYEGAKMTPLPELRRKRSGADFTANRVTHYWPGPQSMAGQFGLSGRVEGGIRDAHGNLIWGKTTMEDYLEGKGDYVTVAMDRAAAVQGSYLASPQYPGVVFRVMDNGAFGNNKTGLGWVDIAYRDPDKAKASPKQNVQFRVIMPEEAAAIRAKRK